MATVTLDASAVVTLNGAGAGTAQVGPTGMRERWQPAVASVKTNQATVTNEATCKIYCGADASPPNFVDGTLSGSSGDSTANISGQAVLAGEYVLAVWAGGDPGAQGYLVVTGTKTIGTP
jgi:hypothetical protein